MYEKYPAFGLLKTFHKKEYLEDFLNGYIYCNHASYYRHLNQPGVADRFESCMYHASTKEDIEDTALTLNNHKLTYKGGLRGITSRKPEKEYWLHCWFILGSDPHIERDFNRLCEEFGSKYIVFVGRGNVSEFVKRMGTAELDDHKGVRYSKDPNDWGNFCKSDEYAYQREYRFAYLSKSSTKTFPSTHAIKIHQPKGFRDLVKVVTKDAFDFSSAP